MRSPREIFSKAFEKATGRIQKYLKKADNINLKTTGSRSVEAWFLGPRAENAYLLKRLIVQAIDSQAEWRNSYFPEDPCHITDEIKQSDDYIGAIKLIEDSYTDLLEELKKSVPFFSMRYQGHMGWDTTIPSVIGYFAGMLYNSNNVAFEASTVTTKLEIEVGNDLCRMLGYPVESASEPNIIPAWGHITCGGTVANIEAIWSARNLKFYPIAIQQALLNDDTLKQVAQDIKINAYSPTTGREDQLLINLDTWQLLNLKVDGILDLSTQITKKLVEKGVDENQASSILSTALSKYSVQDLGIQEFSNRYLQGIASPVFFVPGSKHYSFPKAAAVLGIGASHMIDVEVDEHARMRLDLNPRQPRQDGLKGYSLRQDLQYCLDEKISVYTVVAVMGTTEESAVDPLEEILKLRDEFSEKGLDFTVHADAAWGGYFVSLIRTDADCNRPTLGRTAPPISPLSAYVETQFKALPHADSITVDPHKSGYIPYPAGALCYRNSAMRNLVTFVAPYVFHGETEPTIGIYGIEGSKPGAAPAAVYLSHKVIPPTQDGYGRILGQALFSGDKLYARLLCMVTEKDPFIIVPLTLLPDSISIDFIRERIDRKTNEEIAQDPEAMEALKEIGPDLNILIYALNYKNPDGTLNTSLEAANRLNKRYYEILSIDEDDDINDYPMIVSTTDFTAEAYGAEFIQKYQERLGVTPDPTQPITVIRTVVQDPWKTETAEGSFIDEMEQIIRESILRAMKMPREK
ncbi:pyridoxal phosphate-dependent decarboxylase family protein [Microseira sp. BLCC-F43]|jgi:glutamate/tyrosine decarboxylase-like PLP-dependent enzyme|uniref:pyridoxal phosphate-dependent decarboxylase family protein n=1 Tax=Microseira sp. BLCC-F43 TaxID=3153602 RepID=UPI0035BA7680